MEVLHIILNYVKGISCLAIHQPLCSALAASVLVLFIVRIYCRLTVGVCHCKQDMSGKTVLITGSSAGVGKATAMGLAKRNARIIMACRGIPKAQEVADEIKRSTGNQNIVVKELDLCSFESVRKCAADVLKTEKELHVLINNAGISGGTVRTTTKDGNELIMQSNHFGHFLLTLLLLDLLKKSSPSRIINVSSMAYNRANLDFNDLNTEKKPFKVVEVYGNSKLANILFSNELAKRLSGTGVTVNSLHPGVVKSEFLRFFNGIILFFLNLFYMWIGKTSEEGAQTSIHLAVSPKVQNITGKYFSDCKEKALSETAQNFANSRRLFTISERITGISLNKE